MLDLVPEGIQKAAAALPKEYVGMSEEELWPILRKRRVNITPTDYQLRYAFWREYEFALQCRRKMMMTNVYSGVCAKANFDRVMGIKEKLAWILCVPADYRIATEEALLYGLKQLRDILSKPHITLGGKLDARAAAIKVEIVKMLDIRVKGSIPQITKNLNVHMDSPKAPPQGGATQVLPRMEDIDARLKELEALASSKTPAASPPLGDEEDDESG